jgi:transposase-like protein
MLANPDIGVAQIAHHLGVSPATLYRSGARLAGGAARGSAPPNPYAARRAQNDLFAPAGRCIFFPALTISPGKLGRLVR